MELCEGCSGHEGARNMIVRRRCLVSRNEVDQSSQLVGRNRPRRYAQVRAVGSRSRHLATSAHRYCWRDGIWQVDVGQATFEPVESHLC